MLKGVLARVVYSETEDEIAFRLTAAIRISVLRPVALFESRFSSISKTRRSAELALAASAHLCFRDMLAFAF